MKYLILAISISLCGCQTVPEKTNYEICTEKKDRYGGMDACMAEMQRIDEANDRARAAFLMSGGFQSRPMQMQYTPMQIQPAKQIDFACVNQCTQAGMLFTYCQSKCSY